jgi:hypothetical protein
MAYKTVNRSCGSSRAGDVTLCSHILQGNWVLGVYIYCLLFIFLLLFSPFILNVSFLFFCFFLVNQ